MSLRKNAVGNTKAYFEYVLKHNWQHLVFYGILMLLVVVLPTFMIAHEAVTNSYDQSYSMRESNGSELTVINAVLTFVTSCAVAVFASMSSCGYVNSKQAVGCFHSFPLTRTTLYLTESAVRGIYYLVSLGVTAFLSYSIISFNFPVIKEANTFYFQMLLLSVFAFALFYSIGMFASGLAGTGLLRFLMMCLAVFLPIALYALICAAVSEGMPNVDIDAYLDFEFVKWLCPVTFLADIILRLAGEGEPINYALSLVLVLIPTAVFYGAGLFLHLKRKSETSGTSIIWKPVFSIIKYVVIFACTLAGELFFGLMAGEEEWLVFGGLVGLLLSFMLTNVILYRSVRSLFKGVKGLCVMAVVMVVFSIFTICDAANMNAHMWSAGNTRSITITLDDVTVEYTDDEDIDTIVPLLREFLKHQYDYEYQNKTNYLDNLIPVDQTTAEDMDKWMEVYRSGKYYEYYDGYDYHKEYVYYETEPMGVAGPKIDADENMDKAPETSEAAKAKVTIDDISIRQYDISTYSYGFRIRWRQTPYAGIPSCKLTSIDYTVKTKPLIEYILSTDEHAAAINSVREIPADLVGDLSIRLFDLDTVHFYSKYDDLAPFFDRLISLYDYSNEKRMSSPLVGRINIWADSRYTLPVYAEDYEIINLFGEWYGQNFSFKSADDVYEFLADQSDAVFIIEKETGRTVSVVKEAEQEKIFSYLPHTEIGSQIPCETDGEKYLAVVVHRFKGNGDIVTYTTPIRPGDEGAVGKLFPVK